MARSIGIDLGTTNSVVAFLDGDRYETIINSEGGRITPSVVLLRGAAEDREVIVGELAKRQLLIEPGQVVRSVKRIMGKRFEDVSEEERRRLPYEVVESEGGMAAVRLADGTVARPEEISAHVLSKMRQTAENFLHEEVTEAVITVPAHFNDQQRVATKLAAEAAGLSVQRIVNEPTAAALAYGLGRERPGSERVAVFDFGGGTFDISLLELSGDIFEVIATGGDNQLGGDDLDNRLVEEIRNRLVQQTGIDPIKDRKAMSRIHEAAEKAKCELSTLNTTQISLPFIVADQSGPKHLSMDLSRTEFNSMMEPFFRRLLDPCRQVLADAKVTPDQVSSVLLVGGSTRIPRVQELVQEFFQKPPNRSVNPDEVVACGAAVQSGVVTGYLREVLLLDVTPLTLGLELAGDLFKPIIPRNSTLPCHESRKFTTVVDNQSAVTVHVLQGERPVASENHSLARFRLTGIPPAPKELPEIEVRFAIDANGILSVSAMDLITGRETGVVMEDYGDMGLPREQVERLVEEARARQREDAEALRFAGRRQESEKLQVSANRLVEVLAEEIEEDDLKALKESMLRLDLAMMDRNEAKMKQLEERIQEILLRYEDAFQARQVLEGGNMPPARSGSSQRRSSTAVRRPPSEEELAEGLAALGGEAPPVTPQPTAEPEAEALAQDYHLEKTHPEEEPPAAPPPPAPAAPPPRAPSRHPFSPGAPKPSPFAPPRSADASAAAPPKPAPKREEPPKPATQTPFGQNDTDWSSIDLETQDDDELDLNLKDVPPPPPT